ncbi:hypothetical protein L9F63_023399, partial [Diploptera punctata]
EVLVHQRIEHATLLSKSAEGNGTNKQSFIANARNSVARKLQNMNFRSLSPSMVSEFFESYVLFCLFFKSCCGEFLFFHSAQFEDAIKCLGEKINFK